MQHLKQHRAEGPLQVTLLSSFLQRWLLPRIGSFNDLDTGVELRFHTGRDPVDFSRSEMHLAIRMGLGRFRRPIRDYFAICDSYFKAVRSDHPRGIEAIDMARRGLHNEGAELLQDCLDGKVAMDFDTARRLFTLICVLHIKQSTTSIGTHPPSHARAH